MAHCQPSMADQVRQVAPEGVASSWFDDDAASSDQGLGCAGNGRIAICSDGNQAGDYDEPYLRAYGPRGAVRWNSGDALDSWAWTSVPIVSRSGGAIMADDSNIVRFDPTGAVRWRTPTPGGRPISPTQTRDGTIVLATKLGPISAYDPASGRRLGKLQLNARIDGFDGFFDTTNTPARRGNRIYVSTEFTLADSGLDDPNHHARLYAIDVDPAKPRAKRLRVAWHYDFGARSGASPLIRGRTIVFDGDRATPSSPPAPRFFGLRDEGDHAKALWQHPLDSFGVASAAADPRGGAWIFSLGRPTLSRIAIRDGSTIQKIDLDALVGEPGLQVPLSAMSIAKGPRGEPTMLVSARERSSVFVAAVDLKRERLVWKHRLPSPVQLDTPMGQFPVIGRRDGKATVVFTTRSGVRGLRGPVP